MPVNYYRILQISPDASPGEIKHAYRKLSRIHHPDHGEEEGGEKFIEVHEAYEVLSDPGRREAHDRALEEVDDLAHLARPAEPLVPEPFFAEPLAPAGRDEPPFEGTPSSLLGELGSFGAAWERPRRELELEVVLSPADARKGGRLSVEVPIERTCEWCGGSGRTGFSDCDFCEGVGSCEEAVRAVLAIPAWVRDGAVIPLALGGPGLYELRLSVHVRVSPCETTFSRR